MKIYQPNGRYTDEFAQAVIEDYSAGLGYGEIARKYNLVGSDGKSLLKASVKYLIKSRGIELEDRADVGGKRHDPTVIEQASVIAFHAFNTSPQMLEQAAKRLKIPVAAIKRAADRFSLDQVGISQDQDFVSVFDDLAQRTDEKRRG